MYVSVLPKIGTRFRRNVNKINVHRNCIVWNETALKQMYLVIEKKNLVIEKEKLVNEKEIL